MLVLATAGCCCWELYGGTLLLAPTVLEKFFLQNLFGHHSRHGCHDHDHHISHGRHGHGGRCVHGGHGIQCGQRQDRTKNRTDRMDRTDKEYIFKKNIVL